MDAALRLEHRLTEAETRIAILEKQQADYGELVKAVTKLAEREKNVESDVKEIKNEVKNINSKPAKRWELIVTTAITVILTAVITYALTKIGF